ncbi:MAG: succinate dehydrogenase, hydrophobic membrane anchor protein [Xanthobacteraceae bacterium]
MRTPLRRVRGLGPAHSGTGHFWLQRTTAIANVPLVIYFVFVIATLTGRSHAAVAATLGQPAVVILMLAAILSIIMHMRVGMQMIIEDYVHHEGTKVTLLLANTFFTIAVGLTATFAICRISFGL